ncbi:hypothetical protein B0H17DRAFT_1194713 [Mycena rosella]|uniref:Uncharacterized protein n=1 Tax=Mycena rosella TaxID=1033263 RepID=A0AAD7DXK7_MYCRO|nr:hypothetical protein B0H17DRAFT_1194713 [Mycena rosella]
MTERKKRKNAGGAPSNHPPKKAKTPDCTVCPGSPDPLQCMHTEAGRTFLATRTALLSKTHVVTPTKPTSAWGEQTPQSFTGSSPDSSPAPYRAPNAPLNPYIRGGGIMQPQFHPQQFPPQFPPQYAPQFHQGYPAYGGYAYGGWPGYPPLVRDIRRLVSRTTPTTVQSQESVAGVQPERLTDLQTTLLPPRTPPQIDPLLSEPSSAHPPASTSTTSEPSSAHRPASTSTISEPSSAHRPASTSATSADTDEASIDGRPTVASGRQGGPEPAGGESDGDGEGNGEGDGEGDDDDKDDDEEDSTGESTSGGNGGLKARNKHVTAGNPLYEWVDGVMRGKSKLKVYRRRPLPATLHKEPSRRFNKIIPDIIARCEHLGAETGCYILISAAHRGAGNPPIHYTSNALRKDALPEATQMINTFQQTIGVLRRAHSTQAKLYTQDVMKLEAELAEVAAAEEKARLALAASTSQITLQAEVIAALQARLAGQAMPLPDEASGSAI